MGKRRSAQSSSRQRLQPALALSSDRYHLACFEAAIDAMLIADDRGYYVDANPAACALFGLPREALLGCCIADFAQTEFDFDQAWQAFLVQGQGRGEFAPVRPDGTVREVEYAATAHITPHYHLAILRDVTERRQLEHQVRQLNQELEQRVIQRTAELEQANLALQATNQRLAAESQQRERAEIALACAEDGMWDWNTETNEVYFSPLWKAMLGYADDEIGHTLEEWDRRIHPADRDRAYAALQEHFNRQTPIYQSEHRLLAKDGTWKWFLDRGKVVAWKPDGTPLRVIGTHVDITARKQLEQALEASRAGLTSILNYSLASIAKFRLFTDGSSIYDYYSPQSKVIYGYSPKELIEKPDLWRSRVLPEDWERVIFPAMQAVFQGQTQVTLEYRFCHRDESVRWLQEVATAQWDDQQNAWIVITLVTDITDRKQADDALRESEERLRLALESAQMGYWDWNFITNEVIWSASLEQLMGLAPGTFDRRFETVAAMMHPDDRPRVFDAINRSVETGEPYDVEFRFIKPDGTIRWAAGRGNVVRDATGRVVRMMGVDMDITDRKEAEMRLQEREAEFRAFAENTPDCILRCDRQLRYLYVNPVVARLNQLPTSAILGKTAQDMGWPEHLVRHWSAETEQVFSSGQMRSLEYTLPLSMGDVTLDARIVPEFDATGKVTSVLVVARDITPLKQAQLTLLQQAERERILRQITHHIRESLAVDQVLNTTVQEVRQLLQVDRVLIYRFCPDWSGDIIAESVAQPWQAVLGSHIHDPCFQGDLITQYRDGRINQIDDIHTSNLPPCYLELLTSFEIRANLIIPISHQDKLWGLLCVHYCGEPHTWQNWEVDILQQITDQLAIAIQQSELHQQLQQWAITLEKQVQERTAEIQRNLDLEAMLQRITERVRNSLDEDQILETVVQELGQVLDLECCDTGIYNSDRTQSTIAHEFTQSACVAKGTTFAIASASHYDIYTTLFQGQAVQFCDLIPCPFRTQYHHVTVLACPILNDQQVVGDLWLYRHAAFTLAEMQFVQQISNQCAIALRQSRLYQAAQAQVVELERLNRLKDDFLSTVSHELRTPMSNIKMATQMLEITLGNLGILTDESTPINRYFNVLREEGQREINLINDLLDLTRVDAGMETLNFTTVDLPLYLPPLIRPFVERTRQQNQQFVLQIPTDLPPLTTDLSYLDRTLSELLHNACKYTPPQETITLSAEATSTDLMIQVTNSGVEIPAVEYDRVFDRFYRIPNNDPWKHGGTGLGLALVKKLVERLGGTIGIESGNSQTTFMLTFPLSSA